MTLLLLFLLQFQVSTEDVPKRPVHTYSIVAYDAATGEVGAAVQSHWFSVGSIVIWAESGVGAVATQSFVKVDYGPLGLEAMNKGKKPKDILKTMVAEDEGRDVRQVAMVDINGNVAAHTGAKCIDYACDSQGDGFSVQANMMLKGSVCEAMEKAFKNTKGNLATRIMAALKAAEGEGGDIRGKQSAAIKIVKAKRSEKPWEDVVMDLRVEDHPDPINELSRIVDVHNAYNDMNKGDLALEHGDTEAAMKHYQSAVNALPGRVEPIFWQAVNLLSLGRQDEALPLIAKVFKESPQWRKMPERLVKVGLLPNDKDLLTKLKAL